LILRKYLDFDFIFLFSNFIMVQKERKYIQ
jgi:hypothetical protein